MRRDVAFAHEAVDVQTFPNLEVEPRLRRLRRGSCRCPQPRRGNDHGRGRLQHGCYPQHDLETIHEELLNTCCVLAGIAVGEAANAPVEAEARAANGRGAASCWRKAWTAITARCSRRVQGPAGQKVLPSPPPTPGVRPRPPCPASLPQRPPPVPR